MCLNAYREKGVSDCVHELSQQLLNKKVKFPLLEFCAYELYREVREEEHIQLCDEVEMLKTEGGNVLLGIILQNRLAKHFDETLQKTTEYVSKATIWYVCDIIGERVYGFSMLNYPDATIPIIAKLTQHDANWVVRAVGAGVHNAVRKGLARAHVETLFPLLLAKAGSKDKEIRQGIGWAAKTTARYHPGIIDAFREEIGQKEKVANWFRRKVNIGLERNRYAEES